MAQIYGPVDHMPVGRRDANEPAIIRALEKAGCRVLQLEDPQLAGVPDLLVASPTRGNVLLEVKTERGLLSSMQKAWHAAWLEPVWVVRSVADAYQACGIRAEPIPAVARNVAQAGRRRA